jgi:uncharacterized protein YjbI with pentapeptide repeats
LFSPIALAAIYALQCFFVAKLAYLMVRAHRNEPATTALMALRLPVFFRWVGYILAPENRRESALFIAIGLGSAMITPVIVASFWWRSLVKHDPVLSLTVAASLFACLVTMLLAVSYFLSESDRASVRRSVALAGASVVAAAAFLLATAHLIGAGPLGPDRPLIYAQLEGARISEPPNSYVHRFAWVREFDAEYQRPGSEAAQAYKDSARFEEEWAARRKHFIASFRKAELTRADLRGAKLREAFLVGVKARGANFEFADLYRAELEGIDAPYSRFGDAELVSAHMEGGEFKNADFRSAKLAQAQMQETNFENVDFSDAILFEARLDGALMRGADLVNADLRKASLRGANLREADFRKANLESAVLEGALLWGADLSTASNLTAAQLEGALLDDATILPPGLHIDRRKCPEKSWQPNFPYRVQWWTATAMGDVCPKTTIEVATAESAAVAASRSPR